MLNIATLVGARPQFIKAAALSRVFKTNHPEVKERIIHSGQHYDSKMSEVFFEELEIDRPHFNLEIGSGSHANQTAGTMMALEKVLMEINPDVLIIFGDTNTTLAGALTASKLGIPIAHVESGLRSFNMDMPEEINRIISDRLSTFLFCPTSTAVDNLRAFATLHGGRPDSLHPFIGNTGDVMYDTCLYYSQRAKGHLLENLEIEPENYILATVHRDFNTDSRENLQDILLTMEQLADKYPVVFPVHPRTRSKLTEFGLKLPNSVLTTEPLSYLDMLQLEANARFILTDSGGVQKEAFFFRKPCVVLREETEWVEIVSSGNALLCGSDPRRILSAIEHFETTKNLSFPDFYGDGTAAQKICQTLVDHLK